MPGMFELSAVRVQTPEDVRPAAIMLRDIATGMFDCRVCACHNIAVKQGTRDGDGNLLATSVFGWTDNDGDRWWRTPRLALDSPLPTACRYESEPFWCNGDGFRTRNSNTMISAIDLTNFEGRCLARAAIVVPVHMPFGHVGAVSFIPRNPEHTDLSQEYEAFADILGMYARVFISSYQQVMVRPERLPVGPVLSKREVECLRWAAIGKTDQEISMILSRSRATIRFHMHNAGLKLDAVNRSQTVFKAGQLGYIGLNS